MDHELVKGPMRADVLALVLDLTGDAVNSDETVEQSELSENTALVGRGAVVDSLGLVQIISDVEDMISDRYGRYIDLTDDRALSQQRSPFRTVGTLVDHVLTCLGSPSAQ
jgi:acyl carrier protein